MYINNLLLCRKKEVMGKAGGICLLTPFFSYDIEWATENFSMNVLDIKREESDRHEENTDEKDDKNGQVFRIGKCRGKLRVEKVLAEEDVEAGDGGNGGDTDTEISGKPKRDET